MKIIVFGASGSGTTTLGRELGKRLDVPCLDADDYYWKKTEPPFQEKRPLESRNKELLADCQASESVIVSGSLVTWGRHWRDVFDLAVFLHIPPEIRMERLKQREKERYGIRLEQEEELWTKAQAFLNWAKCYDDEHFDGRSIKQHQDWIALLTCPVLRIEGDTSIQERMGLVLEKLDQLRNYKIKPEQ